MVAPPGDHKYVVAPEAVVETGVPEQALALGGVTVIVGVVFTVIDDEVEGVLIQELSVLEVVLYIRPPG